MGSTWGRFVSWFRALPKGKKYAVSVGIIVATYLVVVPLSNVVILWEDSDEQAVQITCGDRKVERTFAIEEFERKSQNLESFAEELCTA